MTFFHLFSSYTIYPMTQQQVEQKHWLNSTALLVVCGSVANAMGELFVDYFLHGGKVLSLCSDVLHFILPTYRTAEVIIQDNGRGYHHSLLYSTPVLNVYIQWLEIYIYVKFPMAYELRNVVIPQITPYLHMSMWCRV